MLEKKKIGFIGAGMMAEAIARCLLNSGVSRDAISASDIDEGRRDLFRKELGVAATADNKSVAKSADIIILAVKPFVIFEVLSEISEVLRPQQLVISIAAGVTTRSIESKLPSGVPVIRVMPNTPALIGEGASGLAPGKYAGPANMETALQIFGALGKAVQVTEDKLDAVTGLSGSGPAYVYMFIESLAEGGIRMGLPRDSAFLLAAQTVLGAARMVLETGDHPAELKARVMTPGGTTIAGVSTLEKCGFRSACIEAVTSATLRSVELGKSKD